MFHKSVKRNKDTICKEKTKASQEQIIYLKKGTSIIQAPSPVIINMVTSKKPQHWFLFRTQNRKLTSGEAASPGAITPHQSLSQSSLQHCHRALQAHLWTRKQSPAGILRLAENTQTANPGPKYTPDSRREGTEWTFSNNISTTQDGKHSSQVKETYIFWRRMQHIHVFLT